MKRLLIWAAAFAVVLITMVVIRPRQNTKPVTTETAALVETNSDTHDVSNVKMGKVVIGRARWKISERDPNLAAK